MGAQGAQEQVRERVLLKPTVHLRHTLKGQLLLSGSRAHGLTQVENPPYIRLCLIGHKEPFWRKGRLHRAVETARALESGRPLEAPVLLRTPCESVGEYYIPLRPPSPHLGSVERPSDGYDDYQLGHDA